VSHVPQRKISGALHEETGVGFIEGKGTVYRENLDTSFKTDWVAKIVDDVVREQVRAHLENNGNDPKRAFAEDRKVFHKNEETLIKRVRVWQSKTSELDKLRETKFGVRDRQGNVFKWMAYGNNHHVEIIRHRETGRYKSIFVTAMEAARRARGINGSKGPVVQAGHGEEYEFVMALHINDIVSVMENGKKDFYRVQKIESERVTLRLHTAATIKDKAEGIRKSVSTLMGDYAMRKCLVNAIGKVRHDKTDH
jgi:CRISPR-associated endonuclease Csn1